MTLTAHPIAILPSTVLHSTDAIPNGTTARLSTAVHMILCGAHHAEEAIKLATDELATLDRLCVDTNDDEFPEEHLVWSAYRAALNATAFINNLKLLPTTNALVVKIALADCLEMAEKWFTENYKCEGALSPSIRETISALRK